MCVPICFRFSLLSLVLVSVTGLVTTDEVESKAKKIGEDASFMCEVENYNEFGNINVVWMRTTDVEMELMAIDDVIIADDANVKVEFSEDPKQDRATSRVSITKLTPDQFGSYQCSVTGKDRKGNAQRAPMKTGELTRWLPEGLASFGTWHLDGSGSGDNKVFLYEGAKYQVAAPFQRALFLQGKAHAMIKRPDFWNKDFTVHLYIKRSPGGTNEYQTVLGSWEARSWMFLFRINPKNQLELELRRNKFRKGSNPAQTLVKLEGGNIKRNQWHSVAFSWEHGTGEAKIYIDGFVVAAEYTEYEDRDLPERTSTALQIGYKADTKTHFFNGYMAELTISQGALPQYTLSEFVDIIKYEKK
ncbi:uncharacterized protein LOC135491250 [Lineus longissimus]|uniref:uncharacterized protein LOC135491250 n=1 Tax=Lineus longissimus TaxID=88925 RepID=UPI002B4C66F2